MLGALLVVVAAQAGGGDMSTIDRVFQQRDFMMVLGTQQGDCPEGEKKAVFAGQGKMVPGCWFEKDETIWMVWKDGDRSAVPSSLFRKPPEA